MRGRRVAIIAAVIASLCLGAIFSYKSYLDFRQEKKRQFLLEIRRAHWDTLGGVLKNEISKFKGEVGIVIKDLSMDWEIAHEKDKLFPSASLVKIPIMSASFRAAEEGRIKLDDNIKIERRHRVSGSGAIKDMPAGSALTVDKLIELMITNSDNTATNILIDLLSFGYLNDRFKELGLKNTNLSRKMMDFKSREKGIENYTNAEDMACILENIYREKLYGSATSKKCLELLKGQNVSDCIPAMLPQNTIAAHKTGMERNIYHAAGIVFTPKGDFLICVLTRSKQDVKNAKGLISKAALHTYNYFQQF